MPEQYSFGTYIINVQKHARHIFSHDPTLLTVSSDQRILYGALVVTSRVTAPYKLSFLLILC